MSVQIESRLVNRRYHVEKKIGDGGMAEVYRGLDTVLNRPVALKFLRPQFAADSTYRLRFEREAQQAARLSHPNIVAIYDVGEELGTPYIVMEFVDGQTLAEIIRDEAPFHPDDVAILVEQVAAALDVAHQRGIVHRDVKPHNVIVDRQGVAKVTDFGIAKGLSDTTLTEAGLGLGTVQYVSPEQASGLVATPESDIYSLGVVAFEMLTGQVPFAADSLVGIALRHINEPPPDPSVINASVPSEVADIMLRALAKQPGARFSSAGAFARTLTDWRTYEPEDWRAARERASTSAGFRVPPSAISPPEPPADRRTPSSRSAQETGTTSPGAAGQRTGIDPVTQYIPRRSLPPSAPGRNWFRTFLIVLILGFIAVAAVAGWQNLPDRADLQEEETILTGVVVEPTEPTLEGGLVRAPVVVGMMEDEAIAEAARYGLTISVAGFESSDEIEEGRILRQYPAADEVVAPGDALNVTVSSGPAGIDLSGLTEPGLDADEVESALNDLGLDVIRIPEGSETIPEGGVIRLDPVEGVRPGDTVTMIVSQGDRVFLPYSLQGMPLAEVCDALAKLGVEIAGEIGVGVSTLAEFGVDPDLYDIVDGDVVGIQDDGAIFGSWVDRGAEVTLVYYDASLDEPGIEPTG